MGITAAFAREINEVKMNWENVFVFDSDDDINQVINNVLVLFGMLSVMIAITAFVARFVCKPDLAQNNFSARFLGGSFVSSVGVLLLWIAYSNLVNYDDLERENYFGYLFVNVYKFLGTAMFSTFLFAAKAVYLELASNGKSQLWLMIAFILFIDVVFLLVCFSLINFTVWAALAGQVVVGCFVFGNTSRKVFEGAIYVVVTHPFLILHLLILNPSD